MNDESKIENYKIRIFNWNKKFFLEVRDRDSVLRTSIKLSRIIIYKVRSVQCLQILGLNIYYV